VKRVFFLLSLFFPFAVEAASVSSCDLLGKVEYDVGIEKIAKVFEVSPAEAHFKFRLELDRVNESFLQDRAIEGQTKVFYAVFEKVFPKESATKEGRTYLVVEYRESLLEFIQSRLRKTGTESKSLTVMTIFGDQAPASIRAMAEVGVFGVLLEKAEQFKKGDRLEDIKLGIDDVRIQDQLNELELEQSFVDEIAGSWRVTVNK